MSFSSTLPGTRNLFLSLLKSAKTLSQLTQTHAQIILHGLQNDLSTITKLAHKLCDFNAPFYAKSLFNSFPKPDLFLFNVLIRGFSGNNNPQASILLFTHLRKTTNLRPDNFTYSYAVSAASNFIDHCVGVLLHGQTIVDGHTSNLFVGTALVDLYFKFSRVKTLVLRTSIWVFGDVFRNGGIRLDSTSLAVVLPAVAELQELRLGMEIQCLGLKLGFHDHGYVLTGLVSLYSRCGEIESAKLLFREIDRPDLISCNAMISGYTCNGETEASVMLFKKLLASGEKVNSSTIVGLIPVFYPFGYLHLTGCIHGFCVKAGIVSHSSVSSALLTAYSRLNEIEAARQLFDESSEKSSALWNAMIAGYTQNGLKENAISLFQEMQRSKVILNAVTITIEFRASCSNREFDLGLWEHAPGKMTIVATGMNNPPERPIIPPPMNPTNSCMHHHILVNHEGNQENLQAENGINQVHFTSETIIVSTQLFSLTKWLDEQMNYNSYQGMLLNWLEIIPTNLTLIASLNRLY
ncbi:hypothetical protein Patl1_14494 [Pistacia atlantica]|uniref:Uncharacterized protein n=1 Tax=Pistacia atlantica TaxID=434234 RepID=A0ACC1ATE2_9ROSI|nr:hypothetical protein Patl1_14494 [Pistacia atlantica]